MAAAASMAKEAAKEPVHWKIPPGSPFGSDAGSVANPAFDRFQPWPR